MIRPAQNEDIPVLMNLYHFLDDRYQDNPAALTQALSHPATTVYVLEEADKIIGTGAVSFRAVPCAGLVGYIDDMVVDPAYRGRGFGEAIAKHLIDESKKRGCIRVELTSHAVREAANKLYQKIGFKLRETNCYVMPLTY